MSNPISIAVTQVYVKGKTPRLGWRRVHANLNPGRDLGIMAHGKLFDSKLDYATAIFNGSGAGQGDNNDSFDWAYRFNLKPFKDSDSPWLKGFEIGHNLMIGNQPLGRGLRGRTAGDIDFYNPGTIAGVLPEVLTHGTRTRTGVDAAWYVGPFGLVGEYIHVDEHRKNVNQYDKASLGSIEHGAWYVTASYLLTGEKKHAKAIKPKHNFDPLKGGWGAWEVAARIGQIEQQSRDILFTHTFTDNTGDLTTTSTVLGRETERELTAEGERQDQVRQTGFLRGGQVRNISTRAMIFSVRSGGRLSQASWSLFRPPSSMSLIGRSAKTRMAAPFRFRSFYRL